MDASVPTQDQTYFKVQNYKSFMAYKDKHKGERCVLMGNGPSLNETNLNLLNNETVIGLNKIYMLFDRVEFRPTYIVCYVESVIEQSQADFLKLDMPLFLSPEGFRFITPHDKSDVLYFGEHKQFTFSLDPVKEICGGFTVTYVALQLLFFMGFSKVILIGVDHHFNYSGPADTWYKIKGKDTNHFAGNYFNEGQAWQSPNLKMAEIHYTLAKGVYNHFNRTIIDATAGGKLQVFPKMSLECALYST